MRRADGFLLIAVAALLAAQAGRAASPDQYQIPTVAPASSDLVLSRPAAGTGIRTYSWAQIGVLIGGGGGGGSTTPGGSSGQIQYNAAGAFGGFTLAGDCTLSQPTITCTKTSGAPFAASATTDTTNAGNITSGTLPAGQLPTPASTTLGGVKSLALVAHRFFTNLSTAGAFGVAQPACADISDATGFCNLSATNGVTFAMVAQLAADQVLGNFTGSTANLAGVTLPSCSSASSAITYNTSTHAWGCNTISGSGTVTTTGTPASGNLAKFSGGTSIVNGDLSGDCTTSGTLAITCAKTGGVAFAASATTDTTSASNITSGTLPAAQLPTPASTTLGGVKSLALVAHKYFTNLATTGSFAAAQPACADISDATGFCNLSATNGVSFAMVAQLAADQVLGNFTGSTANMAGATLPSCSAASSALTYNTSTHAWGCNTISGAGSPITSSSANALAVGPAGNTNPSLNVDASTASAATGLNVKSAAAAGGLALSVISSGSNENLTIDAKGSGTVTIAGTSTGAVTITPAITIGGALTNSALTASQPVCTNGSKVLTTSTACALSASATATTAAPAGTSSATKVMLGAGVTITPATTGRLMLMASGAEISNGASAGCLWQLSYGTGSAPANAAALTGTQVGGAPVTVHTNVAIKTGFSQQYVVTGLTVGTAYWADLAFAANVTGTCTLSAINFSAVEF